MLSTQIIGWFKNLENHTLTRDLDQHLSSIIYFHVVEMVFTLLLMIKESSMIMNLKMQ